MVKIRKNRLWIILSLILPGALILSSCTIKDRSPNPKEWGYDCIVMYDSLGGLVNNREIRETFYMTNSYLFKPSGSTNMLIEPIKDGYVLAGWYTDTEKSTDKDGNTVYSFRPEDRWDFDEDRVQGNMTLYARWIPQAKVEYIDPETDKVMFSKNLTSESPIQPLSDAVLGLLKREGRTFEGYYKDEELTIPYDFTEYKHKELILDNKEIYNILADEFPQYISREEYIEPEDVDNDDDDDVDDDVTTLDTSDLFFNKLGYVIVDDPDARQEIRNKKDEIIDDAIKTYIENSFGRKVFLKYSEGNYIQVSSAEQLRVGGKISFSGVDSSGNPVAGYNILNDIDFQGVSITISDSFSGQIIGNGYSFRNIRFIVKSKKIDHDKIKEISLFRELNGASIENLTFKNYTVELDVLPGIPVSVAPLALKSTGTSLKNIKFSGVTIKTGSGDDGSAVYRIGDVFAEETDTLIDNLTGSDINISASDNAQVHRMLD